MNPTVLTGELLHTYQTLVGNSSTRAASWSDVRALLEAIAVVAVEDNGNFTTTRNGHVLTLHPALTKTIAESGEVNALRRFLQDSETTPVRPVGRDPHLLLVIDGPEARLYRCQMLGGVPQLILPYEAAVPNPEDRDEVAPPVAPRQNADGFFTSMAEELRAAGQILIFDTRGEAALFIAQLSRHDSELSGRIIGAVHIEDPRLDPAGLLAAARNFYATLQPQHG